MAKIQRTEDNIFDIPAGANIVKSGAVYINGSNYRVEPKDGRKAYTSHKKICIGVIVDDKKVRMYGNSSYYQLFKKLELPDPPAKADSVSVGPRIVTEALSDDCKLIEILAEVFGENDAALIMDLAMYMLVEEKAVFQHYPSWARRHALYSKVIRNDSYISEFLGESITFSRIDLFRQKWAKEHIGNGNVYLCYDSTNTNSQAEGVFIVQKGHAKDDPTLMQVNTDYVVRQEDGLPYTFMEFPGSINDMTEASEMINYLKKLTDGADMRITLVCDRGYISEDNVGLMDKNGISFLLMLKSNMNDHVHILDKFCHKVKNRYEHYMEEFEEFGITIKHRLFGTEPARWFHLIWNPVLEGKHRKKLLSGIERKRKEIQKDVERKVKLSPDDIRNLPAWFTYEFEDAEDIIAQSRGRGGKKQVKSKVITKFEDDNDEIARHLERCGFYILVTSDEMDTTEARRAYSKRDCVEKVFQALKSSLGMDEIGVASDDNLHGKSLIWFVAAILHSMLFTKTEGLRIKDRKTYTVPSQIDKIDEVVADRNLNDNSYMRRYKPDKRQGNIFKSCGVKIEDIDEYIKAM